MVARSDSSARFNQSPPFRDVNLFTNDRLLLEAVSANGAASEIDALTAFGARWGSAHMLDQARIAKLCIVSESPTSAISLSALLARDVSEPEVRAAVVSAFGEGAELSPASAAGPLIDASAFRDTGWTWRR